MTRTTDPTDHIEAPESELPQFDPEVIAEADALLAAAREASMRPAALRSWDQDELNQAAATIEQFGSWVDPGDGGSAQFQFYLRMPIESLARDYYLRNQAAGGRVSMAKSVQNVRRRLLDDARDQDLTLTRGMVSIDTSRDWKPDSPCLIFFATPENSGVFQAGFQAGCLAYFPTRYERPDGSVGSSWYNYAGVLGFCALYRTLDDAEAARDQLSAAVQLLRREDAVSAAENGEEVEDRGSRQRAALVNAY